MVACRILLASVLLSSSPDSQPPGDLAAWHEELAPSLRRLALEWQLVDARELGRVVLRRWPVGSCFERRAWTDASAMRFVPRHERRMSVLLMIGRAQCVGW